MKSFRTSAVLGALAVVALSSGAAFAGTVPASAPASAAAAGRAPAATASTAHSTTSAARPQRPARHSRHQRAETPAQTAKKKS
ncbi:hypothetical protein [Brevundimonas aurantiaca]|jgi:hypothetical protein|uniref:Type IV secretory pathway TrbL component n=1 Tax=Brevundimonas aurantiaca TaxID=74316 RepID=A0A7W9C7T5_9CAUL|nr:hypothetical protein [Brevundimonas aurantiaca]MBB5740328.1 type IV secretory pathway TrbL component [Brevundimonas aurantiaca]